MEVVYAKEDLSSLTVTIDGVSSNVPNNMGNRVRKIIKKWEAEGNVIGDYVAPPEEDEPI